MIIQRTRSACTSILVGKNASASGSAYIGRNEDSKAAWPKHLVIHPAKELPHKAHFESKSTGLKLELPTKQAKYSATPEWTDEFGIFEESGINEFGVAMSATESAYANSRVLAYDPYITNGIEEEAMVTVVLPYVKTAQEGVKRLGQIIETHGTTESNGILFADQQEVWYMEVGSGHHWVAQRIPDNGYAIVANQLAIQEIDFDDETQFLHSAEIKSFTKLYKLWKADEPFNFRKIFGTHDQADYQYNTPRVWWGQRFLTPSIDQEPESDVLPFIQYADEPIQFEDVELVLGSHYQGTAYDPVGTGSPQDKHRYRPISLAKTQESHILELRPNLPVNLAGIHWLAMGVTAESLFVPFFADANDTPADYQIGTDTYTPDSAYWRYKLLGILVDSHYHTFQPDLVRYQQTLHAQMLAGIQETDEKAIQLNGLACQNYLTQQNMKAASIAAKATDTLIADFITRTTAYSPLNFITNPDL